MDEEARVGHADGHVGLLHADGHADGHVGLLHADGHAAGHVGSSSLCCFAAGKSMASKSRAACLPLLLLLLAFVHHLQQQFSVIHVHVHKTIQKAM